MFFHRKETMMPVEVKKPDARYGQYLLEQFGGATGELTAALTYWVQSFHITDAGIRDMLQDIAIEEFSHLEMVGKLIEQHTSKMDQKDVYDAPLFRIRGMGPHFVDSQGHAWTAAYINEGGNVVRDLRANIAPEAGARQTYEALIKMSKDEGTKKVLHPPADARDHPRADVHVGARTGWASWTIRFRHRQAGRNRGHGVQPVAWRRTSGDRGTSQPKFRYVDGPAAAGRAAARPGQSRRREDAEAGGGVSVHLSRAPRGRGMPAGA